MRKEDATRKNSEAHLPVIAAGRPHQRPEPRRAAAAWRRLDAVIQPEATWARRYSAAAPRRRIIGHLSPQALRPGVDSETRNSTTCACVTEPACHVARQGLEKEARPLLRATGGPPARRCAVAASLAGQERLGA